MGPTKRIVAPGQTFGPAACTLQARDDPPSLGVPRIQTRIKTPWIELTDKRFAQPDLLD